MLHPPNYPDTGRKRNGPTSREIPKPLLVLAYPSYQLQSKWYSDPKWPSDFCAHRSWHPPPSFRACKMWLSSRPPPWTRASAFGNDVAIGADESEGKLRLRDDSYPGLRRAIRVGESSRPDTSRSEGRAGNGKGAVGGCESRRLRVRLVESPILTKRWRNDHGHFPGGMVIILWMLQHQRAMAPNSN